MLSTDIPAKFPIAFADGAGGGFIRPIPEASQIGVQNGAASLTDGFPPNCFAAIAAGGSWPFGQDMNGLMNQVTSWERWVGAGGPVVYDAAFAAAIGGYPAGAVLRHAADANQTWITTSENNATNPDTGGAGWYNWGMGRVTGPPIFVGASTGSLTGLPPGTNRAIVWLLGGGGAGGAVPGTAANQVGVASGGTAGALVKAYIPGGVAGAAIVIGGGSGDTTFTAAGGSTIVAKGGPAGVSSGLLSTTGGVGATVRGIYSSGSTPVGSLGVFEQDDGIIGGVGHLIFLSGGTVPYGFGGDGGQREGFGGAGRGCTDPGSLNTNSASGRAVGGGGTFIGQSNGGGGPGGSGTNGLCLVFPLS